MIYFIKRKIQQIRNVIKWIPLIWGSFDFDYIYSINVFKFQLDKQASFLESDRAVTLSAKHNASRIRMILRLMDKVYGDNDYSYEFMDKLRDLYGKDVLDSSIDSKNFLRYKYEDYPNHKEIEDMKTILFKESAAKQERAHKLLWKLIEHNIREFWD